MPVIRSLGHAVGTVVKGARLLVRGGARTGRWLGRRVDAVKTKGAGGETGMIRLFDLHAISCAGDTLITIGLAGTIFFNVPLGEARTKVALYLVITMVPFALLAPVVGPLLDHFRHGRRYALAATMLGRAFLAWMISDYIHGFGLYPAAFGVLALSRAYGVARSAAVPRLLPPGLGLSQAGARSSVYGTVAGAIVAPIGLAAFWFGPQWPLRVASVIFLIGMVTALRLPPRADAEPPELAPRPLRGLGFRRGEPTLSGRLVWSALIGSATLRMMYGFLFLFLAFALKAGHLSTVLLGMNVHQEGALALAAGALGAGTFLATAVGSRLYIRRPAALQANGLIVVAAVAVLTAVNFSLAMVLLLSLVTAIVSGLAKLSIDATLQERIPERLRASAFAHSETTLMLAFVAGGALGLIPMTGRIGVAAAAGFAVLTAGRAVFMAARLRREKLHGHPVPAGTPNPDTSRPTPPADRARPAVPTDGTRPKADRTGQPPKTEQLAPPPKGEPFATASASGGTASTAPQASRAAASPSGAPQAAAPTPRTAAGAQGAGAPDAGAPDDDLAPPGYHIYRPSGTQAADSGDDSPRGRSGPAA